MHLLPRTLTGWVLLIFAVMVLMYGVPGAFAHAGIILHQGLTGLRSFAHSVSGG